MLREVLCDMEYAQPRLRGRKCGWALRNYGGRQSSALVSKASGMRLALDGHLTLSVEFVNRATAQCGKIIPLADAEIKEVPNLTGDGVVQLIQGGISVGGDRVFSYSEEIRQLAGIWNLAMVGSERLDVADRYQFLTGGPRVELFSLDGPFVYDTNGMWARIVEYDSQEKVSYSGRHLYRVIRGGRSLDQDL
jgi:hypothetical protein